jgi:4-hydroxy-4-methyl-2-oxoglutarate aldolase
LLASDPDYSCGRAEAAVREFPDDDVTAPRGLFLIAHLDGTVLVTLRLDTRADLTEARRLYTRHGYREVAPFNDGPYADHWFAKTLAGGSMDDVTGYQNVSPTTLADILGRRQVMDIGIRPLWAPVPRVTGPAYTVKCVPGDNLMLHAAIYRAEPGSVIVVEAGDVDYAVAGGNVCAVAQRRGIAAFVVDGVIRDLAEIREMRFPVFARGVIPIPGTKAAVAPLNGEVRCGGVDVRGGDIVVADEEGLVVTPQARCQEVLRDAQARAAQDAEQTLDAWEAAHRARITALLKDGGFET